MFVNICTRENVVTHGHKYLNSYVLLKSVIFSVMFKDPTSLKREGETESVKDKPALAVGRGGKEKVLCFGCGTVWASSRVGTNPIGPLGMISPFSQLSPDSILARRTHLCCDSRPSMATSLGTNHSGPNRKHLQTLGGQ